MLYNVHPRPKEISEGSKAVNLGNVSNFCRGLKSDMHVWRIVNTTLIVISWKPKAVYCIIVSRDAVINVHTPARWHTSADVPPQLMSLCAVGKSKCTLGYGELVAQGAETRPAEMRPLPVDDHLRKAILVPRLLQVCVKVLELKFLWTGH